MDNKLSELSKPVAWPNGCNETSVKALRYLAEHKRPIGGSDMYNTEHLYMTARELEIMSSQHLYSQEYVSALDKVAQFWIGESAGWKKRAEDAEKRIAELEEEFSFIMGQNDGMEKELRDKDARIEHLEAKLATPVRLPVVLMGYQSDDYRIGFMEGVERSGEEVRAAGFTVEGDE
ncbi:hypothetical protein [Serratia marcescens]|uniref:hypothetical protein n=1 Tax=Serratia marcescens TaxID=615 RepID=UPI001867EEE8|nr:hypothetical protein [Serratia marcescens]